MMDITARWIEKAESDFWATELLFRKGRHCHYGICFHAQQCAEKYLKARLVEARKPFPPTNDLSKLLTLVKPLEPEWVEHRDELRPLSKFGEVPVRVEVEADGYDSRKAVRACRKFRKVARLAMGLKA